MGDWRFGFYLHHILHFLKKGEMENQETINKEETQRAHKAQMAQINRALGVFLLFFGAVVISSLLFTETFVGKMTNLVAGLILVLIGAIFILQTKLKRKIH